MPPKTSPKIDVKQQSSTPPWRLKNADEVRQNVRRGFAKINWKDYFIGFLLMPWIWIWGYLILSSIFLITLTFRATDPAVSFFLTQTLTSKMSIFMLWQIVVFFSLINYSVSFFTKTKFPRLPTLLFLISLFELLMFGIALWPYFGFLFK